MRPNIIYETSSVDNIMYQDCTLISNISKNFT